MECRALLVAFRSVVIAVKAVAHGIKSTAGVVTSAAIVMVRVFSIFATNLFLPRWLEWLPRLEAAEPSAAPEAKAIPVA